MTKSVEPSPIDAVPSRLRENDSAWRQLTGTLATLRFAPLPVLLAASVCLPAFYAQAQWHTAVDLFAGLLGAAVAIAGAALLFAPREPTPAAVARGQRLLGAGAAIFGCIWAAMPVLLLPAADAARMFVVVAATLGVMALAPIVSARRSESLLFLAPIALGAVARCLVIGGSNGFTLAALFLGFGCAAAGGVTIRHRQAIPPVVAVEIDDRLELLAMCDEDPLASWFWQTTAAQTLADVSPRLAALAGVPVAWLEGKPVQRLFLGPRAAVALSASADALLATMAERAPFANVDVEHRSDENTSTWWRLSGRPSFDEGGAFDGYRCVGRDVSALHKAAREVAYLTSHDRLTDLIGRDRFVEIVAQECRAAGAAGTLRALLVLDIEGFKTLNGRIGSLQGDVLLKAVATRLTKAAPRTASIARIGADEFGIVYTPSHASSANAVVRALFAALRTPFDLDDGATTIDVSIGLALSPDHAGDAEELLRKADVALGRAKAGGRCQYRLFEPEFERTSILSRELESDLKLALARGEFELHYQPLFDLSEGKITSFEALIRWTSPTRGRVAPVDFIPAAESSDLIVAIGRFVLLDACRAAASWSQKARIAVNISPRHLRNPEFMADVTLALKLSGLPPTRLEIEITEGVFLENASEALANLHALRDRGVRIALDDFGTGYSSLNYLTSFPVDKIKIDRSFISHLMDRHENRAVVDAILDLARKLGMRVTAEGIETADQALALKLRRCDDIQGYLVSKAQPAEAVEAMFESIPAALRVEVPALFEGRLAAAITMRSRTAA